MPGYIAKALARFASSLTHGAASPMIYIAPEPPSPDPDPRTPALSSAQTLFAQQVVGVYLFYARAIDCTMLPAVTAIASELSDGTTSLLAAIDRLIAYSAAYPVS